jgi:hypothetical protein
MRQSRLIAVATSIILAAALSAPAFGANPARPGTVNYVEGQVSLSGQPLDAKAIGTAEMQPGQSLDTQIGKAEILLTPGAFLRLGDTSSITLISPSLTDMEFRLDQGRAMIEIAELHPQNNLMIVQQGDTVRLTKTGLYEFDADSDQVRVYEGEAVVRHVDRDIQVKSKRQVALGANASLKPEKFDTQQADDLYNWSSLRSSYVAEANVDRAQSYAMGNWYGSGWDWDPYFDTYAYIPGDGVFYSSFGWGFYSPFFVGFAPIGFYGHFHERFDHDYHDWGGRDHYYAHFDHEHGFRGGDFGHGHGGEFGHSGGGEFAHNHGGDFGHGFGHSGPDHGSMARGGGGGEHFGGGERGGGGFHGDGGGFHGGGGGGGGSHGGGGGGGGGGHH